MNTCIYDKVQNIVENRIGRTINATDAMSSLGLDSIEFIELVVQIENYFNFDFPIEKLVSQSIGDFNEFVLLVESLADTRGKII